MIIKVLGSAAGGGFPQWNCNCRNCAAVRAGTPGFRARTQSSLAVSRDGVNWALLNASPDLRQQLNETPQLHADPKAGLRHSPIKAAVLTNGDVDHIIGLINLREAQPFSIYASDRVLATLRAELGVPGAGRAARAAHRDRARQALQAGGRRRRPGADGRSLRRARQGRPLPGGQVVGRLRQPGRRHHRPQDH